MMVVLLSIQKRRGCMILRWHFHWKPKPKRLKISSFDKAREVIEDDGKLRVLEVISNEDEEDVDNGHPKSYPHDINMKLDSIDPPFEFVPIPWYQCKPLILLRLNNLLPLLKFVNLWNLFKPHLMLLYRTLIFASSLNPLLPKFL